MISQQAEHSCCRDTLILVCSDVWTQIMSKAKLVFTKFRPTKRSIRATLTDSQHLIVGFQICFLKHSVLKTKFTEQLQFGTGVEFLSSLQRKQNAKLPRQKKNLPRPSPTNFDIDNRNSHRNIYMYMTARTAHIVRLC